MEWSEMERVKVERRGAERTEVELSGIKGKGVERIGVEGSSEKHALRLKKISTSYKTA